MSEIFTYSEGVNAAMLGHNHKNEYIPQINLALIFSLDKAQPGFFRMIPGSIRDVSTVVATVQELDMKKIEGYQSRVYEKDYMLGTIAVRTTCDKSAQEVYGLLKSRIDIEKAFDV